MCADRVWPKTVKKVKAKFRSLRLCSRATAVVRRMCYVRTSCGCSFRPTRAVGVQELCWYILLEALPKSGAGGGRACSESCRAAPAAGSLMAHSPHLAMRRSGAQGSTGDFGGHKQASPSEGVLALQNAGRGCTFSKIFRSDACGGQFSIGQAAEWHNVTSSDSCG